MMDRWKDERGKRVSKQYAGADEAEAEALEGCHMFIQFHESDK